MEVLLPSRQVPSTDSARGCDVAACGIMPYRDPLDLLWRLVPTPFTLRTRFGYLPIHVESNDSEIVAMIAEMSSETSADTECAFLWRIVRDPDAPGGIQTGAILTHGDLIFARMGGGLLVGADREHRELLGFIGAQVDRRVFKECVFPMLMRLTLDAGGGSASNGNGPVKFVGGEGDRGE
jgi:hypothetical protein